MQSTTPVGEYIKGISPFGVRDMSGNVAEWTRSVWGKGVENAYYRYPYHPDDGRELMPEEPDWFVVMRGGGFNHPPEKIRCADRAAHYPNRHADNQGFRTVLSAVWSIETFASYRKEITMPPLTLQEANDKSKGDHPKVEELKDFPFGKYLQKLFENRDDTRRKDETGVVT